MTEILTEDEKKLRVLKEQMNSLEMYTEEWSALQQKYKKLFEKIEKARR